MRHLNENSHIPSGIEREVNEEKDILRQAINALGDEVSDTFFRSIQNQPLLSLDSNDRLSILKEFSVQEQQQWNLIQTLLTLEYHRLSPKEAHLSAEYRRISDLLSAAECLNIDLKEEAHRLNQGGRGGGLGRGLLGK